MATAGTGFKLSKLSAELEFNEDYKHLVVIFVIIAVVNPFNNKN